MCHWLKLTSFWWKSQLFGQKSLEDCQIFDILHQILVKKYLKKYRQPEMYQYIDTFFNENVSMCRYKYILKVSDTYTVSNTKGLAVVSWADFFCLKPNSDWAIKMVIDFLLRKL